MKKNPLFITLIFFLLLSSSGCWNRRELDALAIVEAVGIDLEQNKNDVVLTVQILKPAEVKPPAGAMSMGSPKGVWIARSSGKTIFEAVRNFTFITDRRLFWAFNRVIIIGEDAAKAGLAPFIDWFERDGETRREVKIVIARGKAAEVIRAEHEQEKIPAVAIENMLDRGVVGTSMVPKVTLNDFLIGLSSKSSQPYAPAIAVFSETKQEGDDEKKEGAQVKKVLRPITGGTAVFKKDKLIGWLDNKETRGLLWVLGKVRSGIIVVPAPGKQGETISLEIIRATSKVVPEIINGKLRINVMIKEEGNLGEQMIADDLSKPEDFKFLEEIQARAIETEVKAVIKKAQAWGVDIFKFGEAFHREYPKEWIELEKRWEQEFPKVEIKVNVTAKLRHIGLNTKRTLSP